MGGVSGVYTMVERKKRGNYETEPWFVSRSEFRLTSRGTRVRFQLRQSPPQDGTFRHPVQTAETVQRLRFDSGCSSEPSSGGFSKTRRQQNSRQNPPVERKCANGPIPPHADGTVHTPDDVTRHRDGSPNARIGKIRESFVCEQRDDESDHAQDNVESAQECGS